MSHFRKSNPLLAAIRRDKSALRFPSQQVKVVQVAESLDLVSQRLFPGRESGF